MELTPLCPRNNLHVQKIIDQRNIVLLTDHLLTLVDLQLDAQISCLFTYNTFIKILYIFRALPCSSSGGLRRNYICSLSYRHYLQVTLLCTG